MRPSIPRGRSAANASPCKKEQCLRARKAARPLAAQGARRPSFRHLYSRSSAGGAPCVIDLRRVGDFESRLANPPRIGAASRAFVLPRSERRAPERPSCDTALRRRDRTSERRKMASRLNPRRREFIALSPCRVSVPQCSRTRGPADAPLETGRAKRRPPRRRRGRGAAFRNP